MCDPTGGIATMALATMVSAGSTLQQGLSAASVARYNARIERQAGFQNELQSRDKSAHDIASQTLALGAQGSRVDTGTPLLLLGQSARNAEFDALEIRRQGLARGASLDAQASNATTGAIFGAGAQLLNGAVGLQQLGKIGPAANTNTAAPDERAFVTGSKGYLR